MMRKAMIRKAMERMLRTGKTAGKILFLLAVLLTAVRGEASQERRYVPGDVLVVFRAEEGEKVTSTSLRMGRDAFRVASIATSCGAWVKETYDELSEDGNNVFALLHSGLRSTDQLVQDLSERPDVVAVSPNYRIHVSSAPNDPISPTNGLWGLKAVQAPRAWNATTGSDKIYVAVIDTGIDYTNPDLADNVDRDLSRNFCTDDSSAFMDDNGHGTHVAGIIGAVGNNGIGLVGMNWDVSLIALKVLNANGNGAVSDVIRALNYLTGLLNDYPSLRLAAVNLSMATYSPMEPTAANLVRTPLWRAMKALDRLNRTVITVAAGNEGIEVGAPAASGGYGHSRGDYVYPASFKGLNTMLSVAALSSDLTLASFSNWNADITAPGVGIYSTLAESIPESQETRYQAQMLEDGTRIGLASGTSMAAPHVAGAAALLMAAAPDRTAFQIRSALVESAGQEGEEWEEPAEIQIQIDTEVSLANVEPGPAVPDTPPAAPEVISDALPDALPDILPETDTDLGLDLNLDLEEAVVSDDEAALAKRNAEAQDRQLNVRAALEVSAEDIPTAADESEYDVAYESNDEGAAQTGTTGCDAGFAGVALVLLAGFFRKSRTNQEG